MPYSSKENVNILTALLVEHGIRHAVLCPGSRNAPILHNLSECGAIECHPVTDERTAGFVALGLAQATETPVVVCVTSGTALLNLLPAVAEAHHQRQPLIVVSADRPEAWIDQLDGQTLRQPGALKPWVARSVTLPEVGDGSDAPERRWHCARLANEAILTALGDRRPCVHINVPLSEPLFDFSHTVLPAVGVIRRYRPATDYSCFPPALTDGLAQAKRPMIVVGQTASGDMEGGLCDFLFSHVVVLHEALSPFLGTSHFEEVLCAAERDGSLGELSPDFVIYVGGAIVSKRLKQLLRRAEGLKVWRVTDSGGVEDTFQHLCGIVEGDAADVLQALDNKMRLQTLCGAEFRRRWLRLLAAAKRHCQGYRPEFSSLLAVKLLEERVKPLCDGGAAVVHYANSSAVRLANIMAAHHVWCNRGVNGIDGTLSTAAGFSLADERRVVCVAGDLSFFYDSNALWVQQLRGNFRILLLNNGGGSIFHSLPGLGASAARDTFIAAHHATSAEHLCHAYGVAYRGLRQGEELLSAAIEWLLQPTADRPLLLEIFTNAEEDAEALHRYFQAFTL